MTAHQERFRRILESIRNRLDTMDRVASGDVADWLQNPALNRLRDELDHMSSEMLELNHSLFRLDM